MFLEEASKYDALYHWFQTPIGVRLAVAFKDELSRMIRTYHGERLLQLGHCAENPWLDILNFRYKWLATPCSLQKKIAFVSSLTMLPIERNSIDCVIAPLTLEAFPRHKNPLDEIDRVLKPMGCVIFFGFNPFSFWGGALRFGHLRCFGDTPISLTSGLVLKRMMLYRGYRQCALSSFYYIPPVKNEWMINNLSFFNEMGKMIWPFPAGLYCFIAQKYEATPPSLLLDGVVNKLVLEEDSLQALNKSIFE